MSFQYRNFTISGSRSDTEGTAKFIQEAKLFLESAGWITDDDNTMAAGSSHQLIMRSTGENGNLPTFYMVLTSGTGSSTAGQNFTHFQVATDWDSASHSVPVGGVIADDIVTTNSTFNTRTSEDYQIWMSGDSEGVVFISRQGTNIYDSVAVGRLNAFNSINEDPYPLYVNTTASSILVTSATVTVRGISGNPPIAAVNSSEMAVAALNFSTNNQPYQLGGVTSIFCAHPLVLFATDTALIRKGAIGTLKNCWGASGTSSGMLQEGSLIASGTFGKQIYRVFTINTISSLIIRQE